MNNKFDELVKDLAQSATRLQPFNKFGVGSAGMALAAALALPASAQLGIRPGKDQFRRASQETTSLVLPPDLIVIRSLAGLVSKNRKEK